MSLLGRALLWLLFTSAATGCGSQDIRIRLHQGDCSREGLNNNNNSVWVYLWNQYGSAGPQCVNTFGYHDSLSDLQNTLVDMPALERVRPELWNVYVWGANALCCQTLESAPVHICGVLTNVEMPPPDNTLDITVDCAGPFSNEALFEKMKACTRVSQNVTCR